MNTINKIVHTDAFKYAAFAFLIAMVAFFAVLPLMSNVNPEISGPSVAALLVKADDGGEGEGGGEGGGGCCGGGEGGGGGGGTEPTVVPTATLTVNGKTSVTVPVGTMLNYAWNSTDGTSWDSGWTSSGGACGTSGAWDANTAQGSYSWPADISQVNCTYQITYRVMNNTAAVQATISVTIVPAAAPAPTCTLFASPADIYSGDPTTLTWSTTNASSVSIDQGVGSVAASGYQSLYPNTTTTYTLTATGAGGSVTCTKTVKVTPSAPGATCTITANPNPCTLNPASGLCTAKITWATQNMSNPAVFVDQPYEQIFQGAPSGSTDAPWISGTPIKFYIKENTQFSPPPPIVCSVTVVGVSTTPPPTPAPTCTLNANPTSIAQGQTSNLSWSTTNATSISINQGVGAVVANGSQLVSPNNTTTYTLTATGAGGTVTCAKTVTVTSTPPPVSDPICSLTFNGLTNATNVDPLLSRVWAWSSANGSNFSMSAVVTNCEDPSQNGTFNPWQPWTAGGVGDITNGSNTGVPGASRYGCKGTNTYVVTNAAGKSVSCVATVSFKKSPTVPAPTCTLNANPTSINQGQSSTLSWTTTGATNVSIDQGIGGVAVNGSQSVSPTVTKTYTLTATGAGGTVNCTKTITVIPPTPTAPTCTLNANPTSINQGQSAVLSWTTTNATQVTINQSNVALSGSMQVSPSITTTYTLTATGNPLNGDGPSQTVVCTKTITVIPVVNAPKCTLNANPTTINQGQSSTLTWTTENATNVSINNGIGAVALDGSKVVTPSQTITYVLTASGPGGTVTCSKTVIVTPPTPAPTCTLNANPTSINQGQSSTLSWTTTNASSVSINQGVGVVATNGSLVVSPSNTKTYTLTASGEGGTVVCTKEIVVVVPPPAPTCTLTVSPTSITSGQSAVLSWTTTNATNVVIDNNIGAVAVNGSKTVSPTVTTEYKLSAVGQGGSVLCKTVLAVNEPPKNPSCTLSSDKDEITAGENVTLSWTSMNATQATLNGGSVALSGSKLFTPATTTTYTLVVSTGSSDNEQYSKSATCTKVIKVKPYVPSAPVCTLSVNPSKILKGGSAVLSWSTGNATSVSIDQNIGAVTASGTRTVSPSQTTTYTLTATGEQNKVVTCVASLVVDDEPEPEPLTCDAFTASPSTLSQAGTTTLTWNTSNATNVSINQGIGAVALDGSRSVYVGSNTLFTLTATDGEDTVTCQTQVNIDPVVVVPKCDAFTATPNSVNRGDTVTLNWSTTNANNVTINNGVGTVASDGNTNVVVNSDTTYTLTASNGSASDSCQTTITIKSSGGGGGGGSSSPRCSLTASDKKITAGERVTLSWNNTRTNDIIIKDNRGNVIIDTKKNKGEDVDPDKDSIRVSPTRSTSYTLTAIKGSKDRDCTVDINVSDVSVTSVRSQVAGISLSSTPYTGFDAGPALTTFFYTMLVLWGFGIAYVLVFKNGSVLGVTRKTFMSLKSALPAAPIVEHLVEQPRIPTYLVAPTITATPQNLSYTPVVGYENYTEVADQEVNADAEVAAPIVSNVESDTFALLEERAHSARVLISSDALRFIGSQSAEVAEQVTILDRVINLAKATYPSENGWVIVNKEKILALLA